MKNLILLFVLLSAHKVFAQDQILCILEKATGFSNERGTNNWTPTNFKVENERYLLIKKSKTNYDIKKFGESESHSCGSADERGFLGCDTILGQLRANIKTMRIQITHPYGYVISDLNSERKNEFRLTPYIAIGKCSSL
jgi:hypothetical protein